MSKEREYRAYAGACVDLANKATNDDDRKHLLVMAEAWLGLIDRAHRPLDEADARSLHPALRANRLRLEGRRGLSDQSAEARLSSVIGGGHTVASVIDAVRAWARDLRVLSASHSGGGARMERVAPNRHLHNDRATIKLSSSRKGPCP